MFIPKTLFLYVFISYIAMFGAVYLMVQCIEILEDYLFQKKLIKQFARNEKELIKHLSQIKEKVDKSPKPNKGWNVMKIYDLLIATNTIGIIFIIIINYKTRKTQKGKGVWKND